MQLSLKLDLCSFLWKSQNLLYDSGVLYALILFYIILRILKTNLSWTRKKVELEWRKKVLSVFVSFFFYYTSRTSGIQVWVLSD